ncbi:DNA replication initiation control protein YabA [Gorillibacterium sp. sgz5001074]|uniref:DNA replication initiation control protein YabA n=1 Tax=Gorillibacterium sp. sgz5001074 TaxID=3446695 RepID=UPI003F660D0D
MDKKEIFTQIEAMEEQMGNMYADLTKLKATVVELLEENKRLGIENQQLRKLIRPDTYPDPDEEPVASSIKPEVSSPLTREGYDNLTRLYHEGFHICNVYYGHLRTEGDCLFCLSFLNK